jgi:hypothetical protein
VKVWPRTETGEAPLAGQARRLRIPAVFEGGATPPPGMHRTSNGVLSAAAAFGGAECSQRFTTGCQAANEKK